MLATYRTIEDAGNTVAGIIKAQVIPVTLEILDRKTIETVEGYAHVGLPTSAEALLLIEVDGMVEPVVDREAEVVMETVAGNNDELRLQAKSIRRLTAISMMMRGNARLDAVWTALLGGGGDDPPRSSRDLPAGGRAQ